MHAARVKFGIGKTKEKGCRQNWTRSVAEPAPMKNLLRFCASIATKHPNKSLDDNLKSKWQLKRFASLHHSTALQRPEGKSVPGVERFEAAGTMVGAKRNAHQGIPF
jgi:hypothetical protein